MIRADVMCDSSVSFRKTNVLNSRRTKKLCAVHFGFSRFSHRGFLTADVADGTDESQCVYL